MNRKSIVFVVLIIEICLITILSLAAFITINSTAKNIITFGSLKIELIETTLDKNNKEVIINNDDILDITHTKELTRIIKVKNVGKQDYFTRVGFNLIGIDSNNNQFDATKYVGFTVDTTDWIYKDGWYYYKNIVKAEEITKNLLTQLEFDVNSITSNYPSGSFKLDIKAEAVQAKNNAENVLDVLGWPSK